MKRNKIRYKATPKDRPILTLTGKIFLVYRDDMAEARKGDMKLYPTCEKLPMLEEEDYHVLGYTGYFRADVFDGYDWKPIVMNDLLPGREHHFSKHGLAIDTFHLCEEALKPFTGRTLIRTYREHYELAD